MTSAVRIPPELLEAIDRAYRRAIAGEGQAVMSRPEFIRMLIAEAVDARLRIGPGASPRRVILSYPCSSNRASYDGR